MILDFAGIKDIILNNPNRDLITKAVDYSKRLRRHIYGTEKEVDLPLMADFEKPTMHSLRTKYAKSNKDLISRLLRPLDKVFTAKGGSVYYNLPSEREKVARVMSSEIRPNMSLKTWVENYWKPHFIDDPCGVILMEIEGDKAKATQMLNEGKPVAYPTYVSSSDIYDYQPKGSGFEYLAITLTTKEKQNLGYKPGDQVYRLIDDANDYIIYRQGETVIVSDTWTLPNLFMEVPAMINSDYNDPLADGKRLSLLDDILELAENFVLKGSIKLTHEFLHGFPKYWEYADDCRVCRGTGSLDNKPCTVCAGTGKHVMLKVSDVKLLNYPQDNTVPTVTPDVAGYVTPPKDYWEMATSDLKMLEDVMAFTLWGVSQSPRTEGLNTNQEGQTKTATEIVNDIKPQADRLYPISAQAEKRHKFILDHAIRIQLKAPNYPGSFVSYGTRYMLEGPDVIWEKYTKARTSGAAASAMDDLLLEYYEARYESDPVKLEIQKKLMKVEPFVHLTTLQLKALMPAEDDYKAKLYFSEWLSEQNEATLLSASPELLRTSLTTYAATKALPQPEPAKPIAA